MSQNFVLFGFTVELHPVTSSRISTIMTTNSFFSQLLFWISLLKWGFSYADNVVYLERPTDSISFTGGGHLPMKEPVFNPDTITVNVGENVHFVARFESQLSNGVRSLSRAPDSQNYVPFEWGFAEADYATTPCGYNEGLF